MGLNPLLAKTNKKARLAGFFITILRTVNFSNQKIVLVPRFWSQLLTEIYTKGIYQHYTKCDMCRWKELS